MKCYNCSHSEAGNRLLINYMGHVGEVYLCARCLEDFKQYASSVLREVKEGGPSQPCAWPDIELHGARKGEANPLPPDAGDKIRRERQLGELREKLRTCVESEDYEAAAVLRDEIYRLEKEVTFDVT